MSSGDDSSSTSGARPWSRIVQWRNWKLAVKLAAVALVPLAFALALGTLQIQGQVRQSAEYQRLEGTVGASTALRAATDRVERERTSAVEHLTQRAPQPGSTPDSPAETDRLLARSLAVPTVQGATGSGVVRTAGREANRRVAEMPGLRQQVRADRIDPEAAVRAYSDVVNSLVSLDRALISQISSPELSSTATALHDLSEIGAETTLQRALVLTQLTGTTSSTASKDLAASETRRLKAQDEFRVAAAPQQRAEFEQIVTAPAAQGRQASFEAVLDAASRSGRVSSASVPPQQWSDQSEATSASLAALQDRIDAQLRQRAYALHDQASNTAGGESVLLVSALLVAGAVVVLIGRQLLGSLNALRNSALHTADTELPRAVANIRAGSSVAIEQIPVTTTEEFGQVARAFDAVQTQAVTLASEQSDLRKSYSDSFVNVSRRSQSLLERQLRLFEQLERDEEDPDQLATLFQLDHLATRMRRNNENLMVLSGADLTRRFQQPTTPADLVRAAVSEIEHYPRVVVQPLPEAKIVGYAASDLVRLMAELLDNAANFSAPTTNVVVSGYRRGDGSIGIDVVDRGIGMSEDELSEANRRLRSGGHIELSTSRRMGLFVVARLAGRHGIAVELQAGPNGTGLHTSVRLRSDLLLESESGAQPAAVANGVAQPQQVGVPSRPERVEEPIDWAAVGRGAAEPPRVTRNGFHLVEGSVNGDAAEAGAAATDGESWAAVGSSDSMSAAEGAREGNDPAQDGVSDEDTSTELFVPSRQEDGSVGTGQNSAETAPTPIFDDLASAWFQASAVERGGEGAQSPWPSPTDDSRGTFHANVEGMFPSYQEEAEPPTTPHPTQPRHHTTPTWNFQADDAQRRAEEISTARPEQHTSAGLPLRVPKAHLVAGTAGQDEHPPSQSKRDPEVTRNRLNAFQQGRHRYTNGHPAPPKQQPEEESKTEWLLHTDERVEQVESALNKGPAEYTPAGLPQRRPRAQLAPGKATESGENESAGPRDAHLVRGRLASFQQGVREGKHNPRTR